MTCTHDNIEAHGGAHGLGLQADTETGSCRACGVELRRVDGGAWFEPEPESPATDDES